MKLSEAEYGKEKRGMRSAARVAAAVPARRSPAEDGELAAARAAARAPRAHAAAAHLQLEQQPAFFIYSFLRVSMSSLKLLI